MTPAPIRQDTFWLVDFRHPKNKRHRKRFPFDQYGESPAAAQAFIDEILTGKEDTPSGELAETIREYLRHKEKVKGAKWTTIRSDTTRLRIFRTFCENNGVRSLKRISVKTIRQFHEYYLTNAPFTSKVYRKSRSNPRASWQKYRQILSAFFIWSMKRDLMKENPAADEEFKERPQSTVPEIFTHDELQRLFDYFDHKDSECNIPYLSTAFRFLAYTGCRPGELFTLRWEKINLKDRLIHFVDTKTKVDRTVPISDKLLPYLTALPKTAAYVFDNGSGGWLYHESAYWKQLDTALKATGLYRPEISRNLYTFRHTFCANLCLAGVPITVVKTLMGHRNIQTTLRYADHFYQGDRRAAIDKLPY